MSRTVLPDEWEPWTEPTIVLGSTGPQRVSTEGGDPDVEPPRIRGFAAAPTPAAAGLLTEAEHQVVEQAGELWGALCSIVGDGPTRDADLRELIVHVHAIQQAVMSQAAGRAYPDLYRTLGDTLRPPDGDA